MPAIAPETKHLLSPKDGGVLVTVETTVTEREIAETRNDIVARLEGAYLNLIEEMKEFQKHWDEDPAAAFIDAAIAGGHAGSAEWLSEQAEMFHAAFWNQLGRSIQNAAGAALDRSAIYTAQRYEEVKQTANKYLEHPDETVANWAWWKKVAVEAVGEVEAQHRAYMNELGRKVNATAKSVHDTVEKAVKIYHHREAILHLPELIAAGQPRPIQKFVETVLMDIDRDLALEIRHSPNFAVVLAILEDHDSALSYLSYAVLMFEAIPPNFYAYVAGKGAAYLMIEVVMLVVAALLSAGAAAAARITMLVARIASSGLRVISANRKIRRAKIAVQSVVRIVEDLSRAADELHALGPKLIESRTKGFAIRGRTTTTMHAKKDAIKRDAKCKVCGSTHHHTPRRRRGVVEYE